MVYIVRRADGQPMGDYSHWIVEGPDDWSPVEEYGFDSFSPTTYELVEMRGRVLATRTLPTCVEGCDEPAEFWGLCHEHAKEDDPDTYWQIRATRTSYQQENP